jgi:hypothetical protein
VEVAVGLLLLLLLHLASPLPLALRMAKRRKRTNLSRGFSNPAAPRRRRLYGSMGIWKGDLAGEPSEKDSIYLPSRSGGIGFGFLGVAGCGKRVQTGP